MWGHVAGVIPEEKQPKRVENGPNLGTCSCKGTADGATAAKKGPWAKGFVRKAELTAFRRTIGTTKVEQGGDVDSHTQRAHETHDKHLSQRVDLCGWSDHGCLIDQLVTQGTTLTWITNSIKQLNSRM